MLQSHETKQSKVIDDSELKDDSSAIKLLQLFQRLLLSNVYSHSESKQG